MFDKKKYLCCLLGLNANTKILLERNDNFLHIEVQNIL